MTLIENYSCRYGYRYAHDQLLPAPSWCSSKHVRLKSTNRRRRYSHRGDSRRRMDSRRGDSRSWTNPSKTAVGVESRGLGNAHMPDGCERLELTQSVCGWVAPLSKIRKPANPEKAMHACKVVGRPIFIGPGDCVCLLSVPAIESDAESTATSAPAP
jgi:hypothetical protein